VLINKHCFYFAAYVNVGAASQLGPPVSIRVVLVCSQSVLPVWLHSAAGVPKLAILFMGYLMTLFPMTLFMISVVDGALLLIVRIIIC